MANKFTTVDGQDARFMKPCEWIAAEFLRILQSKDWFNRKITKQEVLDANDYYDANMAMNEAFINCGREALDETEGFGMSQISIKLWNDAWERAATLAEVQ